MNSRTTSSLVYSTEAGRMCPSCRQSIAACSCGRKAAQAVPAGDGVAKVTREKQGRGGKVVTVVRGLPVDEATLIALGKQLRSACGCGGTAKEGRLEVQGDHAERAVTWLQERGYKAKRAGG